MWVSKFHHGILGLIAASALAFTPAQASVEDHITDLTPNKVINQVTGLSKEAVSHLGFGGDPVVAEVAAPVVPELVRDKPRLQTGLRKVFCVEYARMRSGLALFGDAKQWWQRARNLYTRTSHPVEKAVMVFSGSKRLKRGHVAVVTEIVSPREIIVDHANWQNKREINLAIPVLDVSPGNDWSQVRVWNMPSGQFGARTYAISGFITKGLIRQARND